MRTVNHLLRACAVLVALSLPVRADFVQVAVTGTLDQTSSRADQAAIFQAGAPFSAEMLIDLDTPVSVHLPVFGNHDLARYFGAIVASSLTVNGTTFAFNGGGSQEAQLRDYIGPIPNIGDPPNQGDTTALFSSGLHSGLAISTVLNLFFYDPVTSADVGYVGPFSGTALTMDKFDLPDFSGESHNISIFSNDGAGGVTITLNSVFVAPEPGLTVPLVAAAMALFRRRATTRTRSI